MRHTLTRRRFLALSSAALVGMAAARDPAVVHAQANGSWQTAAPLLVARERHTATLLHDGRVLVVGGFLRGEEPPPAGGFGTTLAVTEVYDPAADTWTKMRSSRERRAFHTATLLQDGRVLVVGGTAGNGNRSYDLDTAEIYDPVRDRWTVTSPPQKAGGNTATLLPDGQVLVAYGSTAERYDPLADRWTAAGRLPVARANYTATLMPSGRVLVTGGVGGRFRDGADANCDVYIPEENRWVAVAPLAERRFGHTATLLPDGRLLVAGGGQYTSAGSGPTVVEIFRATGGAGWSRGGDLSGNRNSHAAVLLRDGRVLLVGGSEGLNTYLRGTELYDTNTNRAAAGPLLSEGRTGHTATLLNDGTVLVVGGRGETSQSLNDVGRLVFAP